MVMLLQLLIFLPVYLTTLSICKFYNSTRTLSPINVFHNKPDIHSQNKSH